MKNKKQQVEIMAAALLSRCVCMYSKEEVGNEIMDFADRIVKLLATTAVRESVCYKECGNTEPSGGSDNICLNCGSSIK